MLPKLKLDRTSSYELELAANETAKMICTFIKGQNEIISIGAEQGDLNKWDDFILEARDNSLTHIQIKRQLSDFDVKSPSKKAIHTGKPNAMDGSLSCLAEWSRSDDYKKNSSRRKFLFYFPISAIQIKEGINTTEFREFINLHIKEGTTAQGLENLVEIQKDRLSQDIYNWLTTWCGFKDWDEILCI